MAPPMIGATQKSHSCWSAQGSAKRAVAKAVEGIEKVMGVSRRVGGELMRNRQRSDRVQVAVSGSDPCLGCTPVAGSCQPSQTKTVPVACTNGVTAEQDALPFELTVATTPIDNCAEGLICLLSPT